MIRLLAAECARLFSRRFTVVALIVVLLVLGAFQLAVNDQLTPPTGAELVQAKQTFEANHRDWEENHLRYEQECHDAGQPPEQCVYDEPKIEDFTGTLRFSDVAKQALEVSIYLSALTAFMIAGSFIGAEYSSGAITNWLSFIPRRGRVFAAKLITVCTFAALVSAVTGGLTLASSLLLASLHGAAVDGLPASVAVAGRGIVPAVGLAALGFCIALVARHTAAAVGALLGYFFVWFVRNAVLNSVGWAQRLTPWAPEANIAAIVNRGTTYSVPVRRLTAEGVDFTYVERTISLTHGLLYWVALTAVVALGSLLVFRRRDLS